MSIPKSIYCVKKVKKMKSLSRYGDYWKKHGKGKEAFEKAVLSVKTRLSVNPRLEGPRVLRRASPAPDKPSFSLLKGHEDHRKAPSHGL